MEMIRGKPENHGLSSQALLDFTLWMERMKLDVNSFMLLRHGQVIAEFWRAPYRKDTPQLLYSLSKSVTSIAVGIAIDQGYVRLNDPVVSFFPDKLPENVSFHLSRMTIHHLLSMNTGHANNIYPIVAGEQDWAKAFLSLEVEHEPGTYYLYNTHATYMLSAIIEHATGENLVDFLMPRLFEPLDIPRPVWETCPMGVTAGGMGLSLSTESMAKLGKLLLHKGIYNDHRIVSETYIDMATREHSDNRSGSDRIDWEQGYGYQFHLCRRGCYRGDGSFGQLLFVAPKEQVVIAATCSFSSMKPLQTLLNLIYEHILDRMDRTDVSISSHEANKLSEQLHQHFAHMKYPVPEMLPIPEDIPNLHGRRYILEESLLGVQQLCFSMIEDRRLELLWFHKETGEHSFPLDFSKPVWSHDVFVKDLQYHRQEVVTYAVWLNSKTMQLTMLYIETPYKVTYTFTFEGSRIQLHYQKNVSLAEKEFVLNGILV